MKRIFVSWQMIGLIFLLSPLSLWAQTPVSDSLCNALPLVMNTPCNGLPNGDNTGATAAFNEPLGSCFNFFANDQSVWFRFTGDSSGLADIHIDPNIGTLTGANFAVYKLTDTTDCTNLSSLVEVGCASAGFGTSAELLGLTAPQDSVFYIQVVGSIFNPEGGFCIEVISGSPPPPPATNDSLCNAIPLLLGDTCSLVNPNGTTIGATLDPLEPVGSCAIPFGQPGSVWFSFAGPDSSNVLLSFLDVSLGGAQIAVYELAPGDSCTNYQALTEVACELFQGSQSLALPTDSGMTYYIQLTGLPFGGDGSFCLQIEEILPPSNDQACSAYLIPVDGQTYTFSNIGAGTDPGEAVLTPPGGFDPGQWGDSTLENSVWFTFIGPAVGALEIEFCHPNTDFDTQIALYTVGDCNDFSTYSLLGANDDGELGCQGGDPFSSSLAICVPAGDTIYMLVDGFEGESGFMEFNLTPFSAPPLSVSFQALEPDCPGAANGSVDLIPLGGLPPYSFSWSNGATTEDLDNLAPGQYYVTISDGCGNSYLDSVTVNPTFSLRVDAGIDRTYCLGDTIRLGARPTAIGGKRFPVGDRGYGVNQNFQGTRLYSHSLDDPGTATPLGVLNGGFNAADFTPNGLLALDNDNGLLVRIDTSSGATTSIGAVNAQPGHDWSGLAYDEANDILYGLSTNGTNSRLYTINRNTGATTNGPAVLVSQPLWLAIGPNGEAYTLDAANDILYQVNLTTGSTTSLVSLGFNVNNTYQLDGDVSASSGTLYFITGGIGGGPGGGGPATLNRWRPGMQMVVQLGPLGLNRTTRAWAIASGRSTAYDFSWTPAQGLFDPTAANPQLVATTNATYLLTVQDNCGVVLTDTVSVMVGFEVEITDGTGNGGSGNGSASVSVTGGTAPISYLWSNGDTTATVTGLGSGQYTVSVTDASGCTYTDSVEIWATGIEDWQQAGIAQLSVYPNPAQQELFVDLSLDQPQAVQLKLLDLQGKTVWKSHRAVSAQTRLHLRLPDLPASVYLLQIQTDKGSVSQRVVIQP